MSKYIIFRADKGQPWRGRELTHTRGCTFTIAENFYNNSEDPQVGDRVTKFEPFEEIDPNSPPCHAEYQRGDWEVVHVEEYTPENPTGEFESIYICYCKYLPIDATPDPIQPATFATI